MIEGYVPHRVVVPLAPGKIAERAKKKTDRDIKALYAKENVLRLLDDPDPEIRFWDRTSWGFDGKIKTKNLDDMLEMTCFRWKSPSHHYVDYMVIGSGGSQAWRMGKFSNYLQAFL